MKRSHSPRVLVIALITLCLSALMVAVSAQAVGSLDAESATICRDVVTRTAVDPGTSFPVSVGKLYCFTKMVNAQYPTQITHVWYYGDTERARVTLAVNASSWRTHSSKIIQAHEIGKWYVDVLDQDGDLVVSVPFEITQ